MEYILTGTWILLEYIAFHLFAGAFLAQKAKKKTSAITGICWWCLVMAYSNRGIPSPVLSVLNLIVLLAVSFVLYRGSVLQHILIVLVNFFLIYLTDCVMLYGTAFLLEISLEMLIWRMWTYCLVTTLGKLLCVFAMWLLNHYRKSKNVSAPAKWLFLMTLFPIISFIMILVLLDSFRNSTDLSLAAFLFSCVLVIANIAILYIISLVEKSTIAAKNSALLTQQMQLQSDGIIALEKAYRSQRKDSHEFSRHIQTITDLLESQNYDDAMRYAENLKGRRVKQIFPINSEHPVIDVILSQKYQVAVENNIDMQIQVNNLSSVSIPTDMLVVVLSNLLDNAIEACLHLDEKRCIYCKLYFDDVFYIAIRNTSKEVLIYNDRIATTKSPEKDHGYGLVNVKYILNQLNAESAMNDGDGWFTFTIEIPKT